MSNLPVPDIQLRTLTHVVGHDASDRTGRMAVADISGSGTPGGSNTQVQFNNSSAFGGAASLKWDSARDLLVFGTVGDSNSPALERESGAPIINVRLANGTGFGDMHVASFTAESGAAFIQPGASIGWFGGVVMYNGGWGSPVHGTADDLVFSNNAGTGSGLFVFGGDFTNSFPALKNSTTTLEARLGDDSAYTNIKGKLTADTNYAAGAPTPTGYLVLYDAAGTAYKVPAVAV